MTLDTALETKDVPRGKTRANGKAAAPPEPTMRTVVPIPLDVIDIGPNVRVNVEGIDELAASIAEHGVLQPIKVRSAGKRWIVVWGQRRVLAARKAGLKMIPALTSIEEPSADKLSIEQLVENLHRADLNAIDRAKAMRQVVDAGVSQADLAKKLGIAPSTVANDLGLLEAPAKIQTAVFDGQLSAAHAKAVKGLPPATQEQLAERAIREGLSAHATEGLVPYYRQSESYETRRREEEAAARESKKAKLADSLDRIAKRIPKDAPVYLEDYYGSDTKPLEQALAKAGYTSVSKRRGGSGYVGNRKDSAGCDCTAWVLESSYTGAITIREACVKRAHYEAKVKLDQDARNAERALHDRVRAKLAEVLANEVAKLGPLAARVALWELLGGWAADGWARDQDSRLVNALDDSKPKRKKRNAWSTLTELSEAEVHAELVKKLSSPHNQGDFEPGWADLAAELGVTEAAS